MSQRYSSPNSSRNNSCGQKRLILLRFANFFDLWGFLCIFFPPLGKPVGFAKPQQRGIVPHGVSQCLLVSETFRPNARCDGASRPKPAGNLRRSDASSSEISRRSLDAALIPASAKGPLSDTDSPFRPYFLSPQEAHPPTGFHPTKDQSRIKTLHSYRRNKLLRDIEWKRYHAYLLSFLSLRSSFTLESGRKLFATRPVFTDSLKKLSVSYAYLFSSAAFSTCKSLHTSDRCITT